MVVVGSRVLWENGHSSPSTKGIAPFAGRPDLAVVLVVAGIEILRSRPNWSLLTPLDQAQQPG